MANRDTASGRTPVGAVAVRPLPLLTRDTRPFWTAGERGELVFPRCTSCTYYVHPPTPFCPRCHSRSVPTTAVSGLGSVYTFTVNEQTWLPSLPAPYVVAIVELVEQTGLRLTTNIVHCRPESVVIGMPVQVVFANLEDVWLPFFEPSTTESAS